MAAMSMFCERHTVTGLRVLETTEALDRKASKGFQQIET